MLKNDQFYTSKHYTIEPIVDRVGGGDSFSGGLIHGLAYERTASGFGVRGRGFGAQTHDCGRLQLGLA
ncbi:MAG: hypothetical protein MZU97_26155 [Bacillus subtilis]|nr:hypothetical protein [Bacillus subtilis]